MGKHPLHLKNPELQTSSEVERAVERTLEPEERLKIMRNRKLREGGQEGPLERERIPSDPSERIEAYIDRLENIFLNPNERVRERYLKKFRNKIYDKLIIKKENFPESYFELQKRVARERGQAVEEIPENVREQMMNVVIEDQKHSLDEIINYLRSNDATYPAWFKYYAWTQLTKLSQFDKERGEFKKRTATTVAPFPALHYGPLAAIADLYERVKDDNKDSGARREFDKKFPDLYAELIAKSLAETVENREEIRGEWVKYSQGDTAAAGALFRSLKGRGTGWCTADGRTTAETQMESGDFYVYYTNNASGEPTQPRLAIRMEGDKRIGEVRGILPHQNVEPMMQETLDSKLQEFGGEADVYRKKSKDMRMLTALERKREAEHAFTKDDLIFLYELNAPIQGFGYQKDPRVAELRATRNPQEDAPIVLGCAPEEIAWSESDITDTTKAYIGPWNLNVYQAIRQHPNIHHRYESFPDKKVFMYTLKTDPTITTPAIAEERLKQKAIFLSDYGKDILYRTEFSKESQTYELVQFTVAQLGFPNGATTDEIYAKADALGLDLFPAEVGPQLRLQYEGTDWKLIAMKQITDRDRKPSVFHLLAVGLALRLDGDDARPGRRWRADHRFVFRSRKPARLNDVSRSGS